VRQPECPADACDSGRLSKGRRQTGRGVKLCMGEGRSIDAGEITAHIPNPKQVSFSQDRSQLPLQHIDIWAVALSTAGDRVLRHQHPRQQQGRSKVGLCQ
jgi:hypothetical protein